MLKVIGNTQEYKQLSHVITWSWLVFSLRFNIFIYFHHLEFSSSCWRQLLFNPAPAPQFLINFFQLFSKPPSPLISWRQL